MKKIVCFLLALVSISFARAQGFKYLTSEDGLSNMIVRSITQDERGLMWLATNWGIQCYNGSTFKNYHISSMICDGDISDNRFLIVRFDSYGRLWVASRSRLFRYNRDMDRFDVLFTLVNSQDKYSEIREISTQDSLCVYIASTLGLYRYNIASKSKECLYDTTPVNSYLPLPDGNAALATAKGLIFINTASKEQIATPDFYRKLTAAVQGKNIRQLKQDNRGNIWVISFTDGVLIFTAEGRLVKPSWDGLTKYCRLRDVVYYQGNYVIAADGYGLIMCNDSFEIDQVAESDDNSMALSNDGAQSLYIDRDNRLWIATFGGGVNCHDPNILPFKSITHKPNSPNSLANDMVRALFEDSRHNIWFGTKKGVSVYTPSNDRWRHMNRQSGERLFSNTVLAFTEDFSGDIWISTFAGGVTICDKDLKRKYNFTTTNSDLKSDDIFVLFRDGDGDIWLSGENGILSCYLFAKKEFRSYNLNNVIRCIIQSRSSQIIVAGSRGIQYIDKKRGTVREVNNFEQSHNHTSIYSLLEESNGNLWLATEGEGLKMIDYATEQTTDYTTKDGLSSNVIYGLLRDRSGNIWMSNLNGIDCYNPAAGSVSNYSSGDGINVSLREFIYGSYGSLHDGRLMFGGLRGVTLFDPTQIKLTRDRREIIFTDFRLFNRSVIPSLSDSPLKQCIDRTESIILEHHQNSFAFDFAAVNLTNAAQNRYTWRLEGLYQEWSPVTTATSAFYTDIPPGNYTFRVRNILNYNGSEFTERSIAIRITSPWWQRWWAYLGYISLLVILVIIIIGDIRNKIRADRAKEKINFFINIAHDIKTPLSLILLPLTTIRDKLGADSRINSEIDTAIRNSKRLGSLINQLLQFEKAVVGSARLQIGKYRIEPTLTAISQAFEPIIREKNISFRMDFPEVNTWMWLDMDKFEKIATNLLDNAVKYTPHNGTVILRGRVRKKGYMIQVEDTGIGICASQQQNIFTRYFRAENAVNSHESGSGIGLLLVRELVQQHGGSVSFISKEGVGTTFSVVLPLGRENFNSEFDSQPNPNDLIETGEGEKQRVQQEQKVLIVDDNPEFLRYIKENIEPYYSVQTASDGIDAIRMLEQELPDITVTDYMMPRMNGLDLCRTIKENREWCHMPVILLTALSSYEHKVKGFDAGADAYLEKPFEVTVLLSRLHNLLQTRKLLKEQLRKPDIELSQAENMNREFIAHIEEIITDHLSDSEFMVDDLCVALGVSYPVLYRKLREQINRSPVDLIKEVRLKRAEELLKKQIYNVSEVAYMTGFTQPNYFSKVYKRFWGYSPKELIK